MAKLSHDAITERFVIGRKAAEKISAVEGLTRSSRIRHLIELSDRHGESGDQRRARIQKSHCRLVDWIIGTIGPYTITYSRTSIPGPGSIELSG